MADPIQTLLAEKNIEHLFCSFVEMSGAPKAKLIPGWALADAAKEGASFAGFACGHAGQGPHDPDLVAMPDFDGLLMLPWKRSVGWAPGNLFVNGSPWPYCPRTILARQVERAWREGYILHIGVEPEFMLLRRDASGAFLPGDVLDTLTKPCYDLRALYRNFGFIAEILNHMKELGWEPYAADHEDANAQFEINWQYSTALRTADRHTFFKWMVKTIAEQHGLYATFLPKPFAHLTGNGAHFHVSLANAYGHNLFSDPAAPLSPLGRHFLGGILAHAPALSAIFAPLVNSYKRLKRGAPRSGATWAPVYITYGEANRTQMVRLPAPGRLEVRTIDGAANPYLASAALLAAGMDGIERGLDPGPANHDNLYEVPEAEIARRGIACIPSSLLQATEALERDEVVQNALGAEYARYYIGVKREEWRQYHESVSAWELENYLPVF